MNCPRCNIEMIGAFCWDDDQVTDHAHNIHHCEDCGIVVQERVANDEGVTVIYPDGRTQRIVSSERGPSDGPNQATERDRDEHRGPKEATAGDRLAEARMPLAEQSPGNVNVRQEADEPFHKRSSDG